MYGHAALSLSVTHLPDAMYCYIDDPRVRDRDSTMPSREERAMLLRDTGDVILKLMCDRASADQWENWLRAPLEHAAGTPNYDLVDKLLRAGASGDWGCGGNTLLHAGAEGGNAQVVRALIRAGAGADKDAKKPLIGSTPLHMAAIGGKQAAAKALIMAGADVNIRDFSEHTPLHLAIEGSHGGLADTLLLSGADPSAKYPNGDYPIHCAAYWGLDEVVIALAQKDGRLNRLGARERTPLCIAALEENLSTVRVLLAEGADANFPIKYSQTVLHFMAECNKTMAIAALVDAGANIEAESSSRRTPLHAAARAGSCAATLSLLQLGVKVDAKAQSGWTALYVACKNGKADAADLLLRWGADETTVTSLGSSPKGLMPSVAGATEEDRPRLERLSKLLAHAPQDRSWRRRGFLVMCRTHQDRLRLCIEVPDGAAEAIGQPREPPSRRPRGAR